jgi:cytochrome P450
MEIISETLFGADVRSKSKTLEEAVMTLSAVSVDEMKRLFIPPRWLPTAHNRKKRWAIAVLKETIRGFIQARREGGADQGDLLSMLLLATDEDAGKDRMTDEQAQDEAMVLFLAGHDTTATALIWTCYLLGLHPERQSKVIDEIDSVLAGREATFEDVPRLRYLKQVIQESLRLYPPAIGTLARENPEALTIGGAHIPKGSFLYTFSYVTHRDPRWFPEPERFDPDRFSPERESQIPQFAYFPFGGGPRVCIGMHLSMMEMTLVLATILQRFRLALAPGQTVRPKVVFSLRPEKPIRFQLVKRSPAPRP